MDLLDEILQREKEEIESSIKEETELENSLNNNNNINEHKHDKKTEVLSIFTFNEFQNFLSLSKEEIQKIKEKYENQNNNNKANLTAENKTKIENDINQLEGTLTLLQNKLLLLKDSRRKEIEESNNNAEENYCAQKEKLEELIFEYLKVKKSFEDEIQSLKTNHTTTQSPSSSSSPLSSETSSLKFEIEKNILEKKLKARTGIEEVLLLLYQEIDHLKDRVNHEIKSRVELEMLVEVEMNELNRRLLFESNAREEVKLQFDQLLRIKNSIAGDLKLICSKLQLILDRDSNYNRLLEKPISGDDTKITSNYVEDELLDIVSMAQELESQLSTISELVDPSEFDIFTQSDYQIKMIEKLNQQSARNISTRKNLEEKNSFLEQNITKLERLLDDQKNNRLLLEKKFENEILELKKSLNLK